MTIALVERGGSLKQCTVVDIESSTTLQQDQSRQTYAGSVCVGINLMRTIYKAAMSKLQRKTKTLFTDEFTTPTPPPPDMGMALVGERALLN